MAPEGVVLWLDDLQWSSRDTMELLIELLLGAAPPILTILGYRDAATVDGGIALLDEALARGGQEGDRIELQPLSADDIERLVAEMTCSGGGVSDGVRRAIVSEAQGVPFVAKELTRWIAESRGNDDRDIAAGHIVSERVSALPSEARALLEVISLGARALPRNVALQAAGLDASDAWIAVLRGEQLVRRSAVEGAMCLEASHDRVREAVCRGLAPDRQEHVHRHIADALEGTGDPDPELMLHHRIGAAERAGAGRAHRRFGARLRTRRARHRPQPSAARSALA
jgi:hypothetical protein